MIDKEIKKSNTIKQKIINAAIELFNKKGYHLTNSNEISKNAGVGVGSFYTYFKDKKSLLLEIVKNHFDKLNRDLFSFEKEESYMITDKKQLIATIITRLLKEIKLNPEFEREIHSLLKTIPELNEIHKDHEERMLNNTKKLISSWKDEITITDIDISSSIIIIVINSIVNELIMFKDEEKKRIYIVELVNLIYKYLFL